MDGRAITSAISRIGRATKAAALALIGLALLACLAIGGGALLHGAASVSGQEAPVTIHVVSNGFHSDIVVPTVTDAMDWRELMRLSPISRRSLDAPYLAIGWGSRAAYTQLGTLSDLSLSRLLKAIAFDESVVHLQPVTAVREGENVRRLVVTAEGYAPRAPCRGQPVESRQWRCCSSCRGHTWHRGRFPAGPGQLLALAKLQCLGRRGPTRRRPTRWPLDAAGAIAHVVARPGGPGRDPTMKTTP